MTNHGDQIWGGWVGPVRGWSRRASEMATCLFSPRTWTRHTRRPTQQTVWIPSRVSCASTCGCVVKGSNDFYICHMESSCNGGSRGLCGPRLWRSRENDFRPYFCNTSVILQVKHVKETKLNSAPQGLHPYCPNLGYPHTANSGVEASSPVL